MSENDLSIMLAACQTNQAGQIPWRVLPVVGRVQSLFGIAVKFSLSQKDGGETG